MSFLKGSRYERTPRFTVEQGAFPGTRPRDVSIPDGVLEHTVLSGQRLDLLALHYYNDDRKWWRILDANPGILNAGDVTLDAYEGAIILIPRPTGSAAGDE